MDATEIRRLAALEDTHWWCRERRALLAGELAKLAKLGDPGVALDVGAAGGGNTRVLHRAGWNTLAIEYGTDGAEIARERGLDVVRADARHLPVADACADLVVAFDVLEHIVEDDQAVAEMHRVVRPGGVVLITVPCDMRLWSAHDVALGHVRRYTRESLHRTISDGGFTVETLQSWNVLLRPVAAWRRKKSTGCDLDEVPRMTNTALAAVIAAERYLPVKSLPGVSLVMRARKRG